MTALIAYLKYNFLYNKLRKISAVGAQNYAYGHFIIKHLSDQLARLNFDIFIYKCEALYKIDMRELRTLPLL